MLRLELQDAREGACVVTVLIPRRALISTAEKMQNKRRVEQILVRVAVERVERRYWFAGSQIRRARALSLPLSQPAALCAEARMDVRAEDREELGGWSWLVAAPERDEAVLDRSKERDREPIHIVVEAVRGRR